MSASPTAPSTDETLQRVVACIRTDDMAGARRLAREALARGCEHPLFLNLRALELEEQGRLEEALADLRRAHVLAPADFGVLNACGLCLGRMERLEEAVRCFDQALVLQPKFTPAWFNRGWALERLGELAKSAESYAKAVELKPDHVQAWACLAWLAARRGDAGEARRLAEKALALQPDQPTAILALANAELSEPPAAERRLRDFLARPDLSAYDRGVALGQLGDALDAQDRTAEAFTAYAKGNDVLRAESRPRFEAAGQQTAADSLAWLVEWAQTVDPARRREAGDDAAPAGERGHVFLLGFLRSGTTLIENVLAAHPDIVSL